LAVHHRSLPLLFLSFSLILEVTPCHHCLKILLHLRNSSNSNFDLEDWDQCSSQKLWKSQKHEERLSFRGVSLERERFSVCCGLQGIYVPGRRWWRKLEIIQPVKSILLLLTAIRMTFFVFR